MDTEDNILKNIMYPKDAIYYLSKVLDINQLFLNILVVKQKQSNVKEYANHRYETRQSKTNMSVPFMSKFISQRSFSKT